MATINANMDNSQDWIPTSAANAAALASGVYQLDSELIEVLDQPHKIGSTKALPNTLDGRKCVRGYAGSTKATHSSGATLTAYQPDAVPTLAQVCAAGSDTGALFSSNAGAPGSTFVSVIRLDTTNKLCYVWNGTSYTKIADYA